MKYKIKNLIKKYVENGKLEKLLHKVNDKIKKKSGKDYSNYINNLMKRLKK